MDGRRRRGRTALAFKTLAIAGGALAAWSAAALARRDGRSGLLPLCSSTWNPLALLETAGNGHNEMVMIGLALLGMVVIARGRTAAGFALVVASAHVKWITAALAGLVVVARAARAGRDARPGARTRAIRGHRRRGHRRRLRAVLGRAREHRRLRRLMIEGRGVSGGGGLTPAALILFAAVVALAIVVVARTGTSLDAGALGGRQPRAS